MKRRNAETGKMRRPVKRTKITEGMYGNSLLYLKFVMLWATVVLADYMLEFRFEFLWPFWMMLRSLYDSFKYQGIAFSVFFICIALTSDMICYFFIPLQYIFFAASTYVWVQYVWYTFVDKGICVPTVAMCCVLLYVEGALRVDERSDEVCRPLAAHCVGYPVVTLGFGVKSYVGHRLRLRRQRQVRAENDFYFQLMRDALPESALEQSQPPPPKESEHTANGECTHAHAQAHAHAHTSAAACTHTHTPVTHVSRQMNGSVKRRTPKTEQNGHCNNDQTPLLKLEKLEKQTARERDKSANTHTHTGNSAHTHTHAHAHAHALTNGTCQHAGDDDVKHDHSKGSAKSSRYDKKEANTIKEERRKKNRDRESTDSHKSTEQIKEHIVKDKDVESTKENVKSKECNGNREKDRERERERETREREKERERERELRECTEELKRVRAELSASRAAEAEARRALAAAAATERQRRAEHNHLKHAHAALQHKVVSWRSSERAALERRVADERRARAAAEHQLRAARRAHTHNGECENEWCRSRRSSQEAETAGLRRDLQLARDAVALLQRDLTQATDQVRSAEARSSAPGSPGAGPGTRGPAVGQAPAVAPGPGWAALSERALHLERSLSAETRVKLDLLSALGEAQRKMHIQDGLITRQEKEIAELKAQMVAVMPTEYVTSAASGISKLRRSDGSPLDPNASVYTPKQLCSDA